MRAMLGARLAAMLAPYFGMKLADARQQRALHDRPGIARLMHMVVNGY